MKAEVKRVGKSQIEITITVPSNRVGEVFEKILAEATKEIEIEGFRKGHAPKNLILDKINKQKVYDEVVNRIVSESYNAAIKEHLLKPIVNPQIELVQFEPESKKDFVFKTTTAERPEVTLGDYKGEIVGPDGRPLKSPSKPSTPSETPLNAVLQTVLSTSQVEIPNLLIENEVVRMLSRLLDQTARLGLTVEQYLQSQGKTVEQLRAEYSKQAEETLKAEFVLDELTKVEKVEVTDKEIDEAIQAAPDEKSREELAKEENKWYIRSVLKRNKTIQRLVELAK